MLRDIAAGFDTHDVDRIIRRFAQDAIFEAPAGPTGGAHGSRVATRLQRHSSRGSRASPMFAIATRAISQSATAASPSGR